jgi:hypothetical protein
VIFRVKIGVLKFWRFWKLGLGASDSNHLASVPGLQAIHGWKREHVNRLLESGQAGIGIKPGDVCTSAPHFSLGQLSPYGDVHVTVLMRVCFLRTCYVTSVFNPAHTSYRWVEVEAYIPSLLIHSSCSHTFFFLGPTAKVECWLPKKIVMKIALSIL